MIGTASSPLRRCLQQRRETKRSAPRVIDSAVDLLRMVLAYCLGERGLLRPPLAPRCCRYSMCLLTVAQCGLLPCCRQDGGCAPTAAGRRSDCRCDRVPQAERASRRASSHRPAELPQRRDPTNVRDRRDRAYAPTPPRRRRPPVRPRRRAATPRPRRPGRQAADAADDGRARARGSAARWRRQAGDARPHDAGPPRRAREGRQSRTTLAAAEGDV